MLTPMLRVAVRSRTIQSVGYDGATGVLEIECTDGALYRYTRVPPRVYVELMHAPSKGSYWFERIHGFYPYERVARTLPATL